jgi:hypothetical protein
MPVVAGFDSDMLGGNQMLVQVERSDYLTIWARIRGIASTALVRLIRIIASDQLVGVRPRRRRRHQAAPQNRASLSRRRDMGEVIGLKRKKLPGFPPSEYFAPESDGA